MITGLLSGLLAAAFLTAYQNWNATSLTGHSWRVISLWTILATLGALIGGALS